MHRKVKGDRMMKENKATEIALHHMDGEIDVHSYLLATLSWGLLFIYFVHFFLLSVYDKLTHGHCTHGIRYILSFFFFFFHTCIIVHSGP